MAQKNTQLEPDVNRCHRCNRVLKDPQAQYGWRCAEILGVSQSLNYAGDGAFQSYMRGITAADDFLRKHNVDVDKIDIAKLYKSYISLYLVAEMDEQELFVQAYQDRIRALTPLLDESGLPIYNGSNTPTLADLLALRDKFDYQNNQFTTTAYTDNNFDLDTYIHQKELNKKGKTDKFGEKLKEDGILSAKTQWAIDIGKGIFADDVTSKYGLYPAKGDTVFGITDKTLGRIKNGKPVGAPVFRVDRAHKNAPTPHLNTNWKDFSYLEAMDHTELPTPVYHFAKSGNSLMKIAKTGGKALAVAGVALDVYDLGNTIYLDLNDEDKQLGKETLKTSVGIGSSYAGAYGGAKLGAMGGVAIGTAICPGLGTAIGGFLGGLAGGILGALGGRAAGEYIVDETYRGQ